MRRNIYSRKGIIYPQPAPRVPGENTLLYMPFKQDLLDHSGNDIEFTTYGTAPVIQDGVSVWDGTGFLYTVPLTPDTHVFTAQCWVNIATTNNGGFLSDDSYPAFKGWNMVSENNKLRIEKLPSSKSFNSSTDVSDMVDNWNLVTLVWDNTNAYLYINGELDSSTGNMGFTSGTYAFSIGKNIFRNADISSSDIYQGKMSELIFEDKAWTQEEIEEYFNATKTLYGIS